MREMRIPLDHRDASCFGRHHDDVRVLHASALGVAGEPHPRLARAVLRHVLDRAPRVAQIHDEWDPTLLRNATRDLVCCVGWARAHNDMWRSFACHAPCNRRGAIGPVEHVVEHEAREVGPGERLALGDLRWPSALRFVVLLLLRVATATYDGPHQTPCRSL